MCGQRLGIPSGGKLGTVAAILRVRVGQPHLEQAEEGGGGTVGGGAVAAGLQRGSHCNVGEERG